MKQYFLIVFALIAWISLFLLLGRFLNGGLIDLWAIMLIGAAIITYFSVLALPDGTDEEGKIRESRIRLAVMSSLLVTYLTYFGSVVYLDAGSSAEINTTNKSVKSFAEIILPTLTQLLTVTISFYFGSTAAIEIFKIKNKQE